jgi:hypothetical protein
VAVLRQLYKIASSPKRLPAPSLQTSTLSGPLPLKLDCFLLLEKEILYLGDINRTLLENVHVSSVHALADDVDVLFISLLFHCIDNLKEFLREERREKKGTCSTWSRCRFRMKALLSNADSIASRSSAAFGILGNFVGLSRI